MFKKKDFLSYSEAIKIVHNLKLANASEWRSYIKDGLKPDNIPSSPNTIYRKKGWISWRNWLGTEFLDFNSARNISHSLGLKNYREWIEYVKIKKIEKVPYDPSFYYKDRGWINWKDWLGHNREFNQNARKHEINEGYFKIWSHDMAYILGLWWADGNISKNGYCFSIVLHKNDFSLLREVARKIGVDENISIIKIENSNCYKLVINSKIIFNDIILLGGQKKKSLMLSFPEVPNEYLRDFIRGYFDGDGSIFYAKKDKAYYASISCGNEEFLREIERRIANEINEFKCYIKSRVRDVEIKGILYKGVFSSELRMNASSTKKFKDYIYSGKREMKMQRKYDLFNKIGNIKIANKDKKFIPFLEARKIAQELGLKSSMEWREYCKKNKKIDMPSNPNKKYKDCGWINWDDWLGKE